MAKDNNKAQCSKSSKDKFQIVMETYLLTEIDLAKYCRENGLYVHDVKQWRNSRMTANTSANNISDNKELSEALKEEKKNSKKLSKELRTKEKALVETAALLVLRKKLTAIFMETEEDS
jgi:hypothetical protein